MPPFARNPASPKVNSTPTATGNNALVEFLSGGNGASGAIDNIVKGLGAYATGKALIEGSSGGSATPAPVPDSVGVTDGGGGNLMNLIPESLRNRIYADAENDYFASLGTRYTPSANTAKYIGYGAAALAAVYFLPKIIKRL